MSTHRWLDAAMRQAAQQAMGNRRDLKLAQITSVDPASNAVKVMLQPEQKETGWIPAWCIPLGAGFGLYVPPVAGVQYAVDHEDGDIEAGVAQHGIADDTVTPPAGMQSGEFWFVSPTGSTVKVTMDDNITVSAEGKLYLASAGDTDQTVGGNLNVTVTGNVAITATGTVTVKGSTINLNP